MKSIFQKALDYLTGNTELKEKLNKVEQKLEELTSDRKEDVITVEPVCKNRIIYNAATKFVTVVDCNNDTFSGEVEKDVVELLKTADTKEIIRLLTPKKVESKGSDFDIEKEEKEIVKPFLGIFEGVDDFEVVGNSVFFKSIRSVEIPSLIVARFVELIEQISYFRGIEVDEHSDFNQDDKDKLTSLESEYQSLKAFTLKLLLNPLPHSREDLVVFMRNNDIRISKAGNLILYRNIVKVGKTNKSLVEFVSNQYFKVKGWKKSPKNYEVYQDTLNNYELITLNGYIHDHLVKKEGNLAELYNNLSKLKENTYTSWHNKGRYTIKIGSIYKIDETLEKLNTTRYACQGGALHAVNYSYNYSYFGDTKVVVLVNPSKVLTIPSNDSGKITTREMWVACYNPNELGVHFDETGLEGVEDEYENYTNEELGGILKSKCLSPISIDGFTSELSLKDVESISNMLKNRIVTI